MEKIEIQVGNNGKVYLHPRNSKLIFKVEELEIDLETVLLNSAALIKNGATTISLNYSDYSITITKDAIISPNETFELLDIIEATKKVHEDVLEKGYGCRHIDPYKDTIAIESTDKGPRCRICGNILSNNDLDSMKKYATLEDLLVIKELINKYPKPKSSTINIGDEIAPILNNKWDEFVKIKTLEQIVVRFPNNFGASIILGYGIELALIYFNEDGWDVMHNSDFPSIISFIESEEELSSLLETIQKYQGV